MATFSPRSPEAYKLFMLGPLTQREEARRQTGLGCNSGSLFLHSLQSPTEQPRCVRLSASHQRPTGIGGSTLHSPSSKSKASILNCGAQESGATLHVSGTASNFMGRNPVASVTFTKMSAAHKMLHVLGFGGSYAFPAL